MTNLILDISSSVDDKIFKTFLKYAKLIDDKFNIYQVSGAIESLDLNIADILTTKQTRSKSMPIFRFETAIKLVINHPKFDGNDIFVFTDDIFTLQNTNINIIKPQITVVDFFSNQESVDKLSYKNIKVVSYKNLQEYLRTIKIKTRKEKLIKIFNDHR